MKNKRYVRINENKIRQEDENYYIVLNDRGNILKLNELGKEILVLCNGSNNTESIIDILTQKYDIKKEIVEKDVHSYIEKLIWSRLVVEHD